ncbi:hypothetical protein [Pseudoalteromonas ulvae]|uniref:Uncharacterized protein n=1 Tax=Pseudoalteromonas ulvae TaxID=107327 RepID=A0A244CPT9_PSEDV|nr:hypothetical protein [Pseudoalteromonas ulvae]OUL57633.1 hypothetical protein B1199_11240 [Pseudoalteromonas ulvae]
MLQHKLTTWFKKSICYFVSYYADKTYHFELNQQGQFVLVDAEPKAKSTLIQIIARKHYSEFNQRFPVDNKKELNTLLKLNVSNNDNVQSYHLVTQIDAGQSEVNMWQISTNVPKAFIQLPESLLLSYILNEESSGCIQEVESKQPYFVARLQNTTYSALKSQLINSAARFANTVGIPHQTSTVIAEGADYIKALFSGLAALPKNKLVAFINPASLRVQAKDLKSPSKVIAAMLLGYLTLTSGYLQFTHYQLSTQAEMQKDKVNQVFDLLDRYESDKLTFTQLVDFTEAKSILSPVFYVLRDLFVIARFDNIRFENERFVLRGDAQQATQVLQTVANNSRVKDAKFDFPTRSQRGREQFVISFVLHSQQDAHQLASLQQVSQ